MLSCTRAGFSDKRQTGKRKASAKEAESCDEMRELQNTIAMSKVRCVQYLGRGTHLTVRKL